MNDCYCYFTEVIFVQMPCQWQQKPWYNKGVYIFLLWFLMMSFLSLKWRKWKFPWNIYIYSCTFSEVWAVVEKHWILLFCERSLKLINFKNTGIVLHVSKENASHKWPYIFFNGGRTTTATKNCKKRKLNLGFWKSVKLQFCTLNLHSHEE